MERKRLRQCLRHPAHYQAAKIGGKGQQGQHQDASQDARCRQQPVRIDRGCLDGIDLLGHFHRRQLRANTSPDTAAHDQSGNDRAGLMNNGEHDCGGKQRFGAKSRQAVTSFQR